MTEATFRLRVERVCDGAHEELPGPGQTRLRFRYLLAACVLGVCVLGV